MTKATCSKCNYVVELDGQSPEGTEYWSIDDAIKYLIIKQKEHKCK